MVRKLLLTVTLTVVTTLGLMAQITTAGISGRVVGVSTGKEEALPGATIVATHVPSGTTYGTATVADGRYTIPGMRVGGPYTIKISFIGYKEEVFENLTLNLGVIATLDVKLAEEGTQLEEVVVTSDRNDIFSADRTGASASYGRSLINSVPTIGRTVSDIVKYNAFGNGSSFAGQDSRFNNFTIDGSVFNNGFGLGSASQAGGRTGTTPVSLDSFDEIQLNVAPFDVRQSGFAGASINAVTRSGTNQVQASIYDLFRNTSMVGRNAYDIPVNPITVAENTKGFRIGAPIIKNKLFIFGNYEEFKSSLPAETFSLSRGQSGSNVSRVTESDMKDVTSFIQSKLGWDPGALDGFNNQTTSKKGLIRLDYNINQNHKLAVRFSTHNSQSDQLISGSNSSNTAGFGNRTNSQTAMSPQNTGYVILDNTRSGAVELNSNFGSRIANKLIATYNYQNEDRKYKSPLFPTIEIQDGGTTNSTYMTLGMDPFTPSNKLRYSTLNITDNFTYFAGDHTITAGVAIEKFKSDNLFYPSSNGVYVYKNIADFKKAVNSYVNHPDSAFSPVPVLRYNLRYSLLPDGQDPWQTLKTTTYSFYVQDEWQVNEKFKVTAGLRGDIFAYDKSTAASFNNPVVGGLTFGDEHGNPYGVNTGAFPKTKLLLSPRIGFNYDMNGDKTLQIRGGSGIFVSRIPQVLVSNQLGNNGVNTSLISGGGTTGAASVAYPFRVSPADLPASVKPDPSAVNGNLGALPPYVVNATDGGLKYPSVWKTNLAVDYKLPFGMIGTGEVIYNKVINGLRYIDANLKAPQATFAGDDNRDQYPTYGSNGSAQTSPINVARFTNTQVTNVFVLKNTHSGAAYTLTAKLEKPATRGIGGMVAYTYGVARDVQSVGSTVQANMPTVSGQNYLGLSYADNDLRHRVIGYANFRIPGGDEEKGTLNTITIGFNSQSGAKYSYVYSNDMNGDGQTNDLIYVPKDAKELTFVAQTVNGRTFSPEDQQAAWNYYIDNNPYLKTRKGSYAERNGGFSPWQTRIDVSFVRDFYFRAANQKHTFQIRVDVLNFMNLLKPSWGIGWTAPAANFNLISPISIANGGGNSPTYKLTTQVVNGQTVLVQDSFLKGSNVGNLWTAQIGLRYILN